MWSANRLHSLNAAFVPVCPICRALGHDVQRSPERCCFGRFLGCLFRRASPGTAALGHRCNHGRAVSLADPVAETCTTTRLFETARRSVAPELSDTSLGEVSDLASKCCPPLPSQSLRLSLWFLDFKSSYRPNLGLWCGSAGTLACCLPSRRSARFHQPALLPYR